MYFIVYPDPREISSDAYTAETAETIQEARELAEQIAAKYRSVDRSDVFILDGSLAEPLPTEPDEPRCPHCGHAVDISSINTGSLEFDEDEELSKGTVKCPTCDHIVTVWFDQDAPDGPAFDHIEEYD